MRLAVAAALVLAFLPGCASSAPQCPAGATPDRGQEVGDVTQFTIHIGWRSDLKSQYMSPSCMVAGQGDKVRFIVQNDDDPGKDYNGAAPGKDNFHDVALLDYAGRDYEHEAYAGKTAVTTCADGDGSSPKPSGQTCQQDWFLATDTGSYRIICEVRTDPTHDALGMHAAFLVQ